MRPVGSWDGPEGLRTVPGHTGVDERQLALFFQEAGVA